MVRLQAWTEEDFPVLLRLNEPDMTEHLGGPETYEQVLRRHQRYVAAAASTNARVFTVVLEPGLVRVGQVTYWERSWRGEDVWECGWGIIPEYQGQGLAGQAVALLVMMARSEGRHRFLHAYPSIPNGPSNAICRKLGFSLIEESDFEYPPGHIAAMQRLAF